jgi:hypothetical protein
VKTELENIALWQEVSWRQKSRATWLKGHNRRFFHCLALTRETTLSLALALMVLLPLIL